jgi:uncharacterized protein (DUF433 family)
MTARGTIDWSQCPLIEIDPDVQGGVPVLRGTQVPASVIVDKFVRGVSVADISTRLKVPRDRIRAIVFYAKGQRMMRPK